MNSRSRQGVDVEGNDPNDRPCVKSPVSSASTGIYARTFIHHDDKASVPFDNCINVNQNVIACR